MRLVVIRRAMGTSRACDPHNAPLIFHWYKAEHGKGLAKFFTETLQLNGVHDEHLLALARQELLQRLREYTDATLAEVRDIRRIERNPSYELFEIRLKMRGVGLVRLYFIEPEILGAVGVGLHLHIKSTAHASDRAVKDMQDVEIDIAARRCAQGKFTNWDFPVDGLGKQ